MEQKNNWNINITPQALFALAVMLLTIPLDWLAAWMSAAAVHELFHCLAIFLCKKHIYGFQIGASGAVIQTEELTYGQTIVCAAAGPISGILLAAFTHQFPLLAICALVQSLFNLLPVYPLDGGRILYAFIKLFIRQSVGDRICNCITALAMALVFGLCVMMTFRLRSCFPLLIPLILLMKKRWK